MYQLLSILIHEMLHYYLSAVYHLNTANHDKIFMDMADKLNESNDFHITPTIDLTDYERIKTKSSMNNCAIGCLIKVRKHFLQYKNF